MSKIRKTFRITHEQQAKLERLQFASGQTESEIVRQALEAITEPEDSILAKLIAKGLVIPPDKIVSREAQKSYEAYLQLIGNREIGLTQAVLEERRARY